MQVRQAQGSQSVTATQTDRARQACMHAVQCGQGKEGILANSAREAGMARHAGNKCKGGRRFGKATQVGKQVGQGQHGSRQGDWTREVGLAGR